jgi:SAM-dependent methyltransferase
VTGKNVRYFDVLTQEELVQRAAKQGIPSANPPKIDYVSPNGDLSIVEGKFDFVISSYCIEHQPDLIKHLQDVERVLKPGGSYFILAPDKRYCHDHFMFESTIAEVVCAHHEGRRVHPLRSVIEHLAMSAHNDHFRHWSGDHGEEMDNFAARWKDAMQVYTNSKGGYVDVHSWYFTPASMRKTISTLNELGYLKLECVRCYHTRRNNNDFWAILKKSS